MIHEKSIGTVIYYERDAVIEYLLLHYTSGHWDFPKGHQAENEIEIETAKRELFEETGLNDVEFTDRSKDKIHYFFRNPNRELVSKDVIFFLAKSKAKEVTLSYEHKGYLWLKYDDALKKLTYENARGILKRANEFLQQMKRF